MDPENADSLVPYSQDELLKMFHGEKGLKLVLDKSRELRRDLFVEELVVELVRKSIGLDLSKKKEIKIDCRYCSEVHYLTVDNGRATTVYVECSKRGFFRRVKLNKVRISADGGVSVEKASLSD